MSRNLEKRLAEVERRLRDVARRDQLANCNCQQLTSAFSSDNFEEEMNRPCPAHGFRDLGTIMHTVVVPTNSLVREIEPEEDTKLQALIATYEARRARHQTDSEFGIEDDYEQF
jgi:hypothetical protein